MVHIIREYKANILQRINSIRAKSRTKIFCIGQNKTGTTSLTATFRNHHFIVGNQRKAEKLIGAYVQGNFEAIIKYCNTAQVFQDFPFSYPETYKYVDLAFPKSKFVLTVRDSPEQWYNSITKYHTKIFGRGKLPSKADLLNSNYVYKGWAWETFTAFYKTPEDDLYNKRILMGMYEKYNSEVQTYFKDRHEDFIVINVGAPGNYNKLMNFLGIKDLREEFPWVNRTDRIK